MAIDERFVLYGVATTCVFCINFSIWLGIYFGAYYPLYSKDWTSSLCIVTDVEQYQTYAKATHLYIQYKLAVVVGDRILPGYACESSENHSDISSASEDNYYPYQYPTCSKAYVQHGTCRSGQLFLPRWMCIGFKGIAQYTQGDTVECKYYINGDSGSDQFSYPQKGEDFIEVLFKEEIYIPPDYYALWVIPFGIFSVLPCLLFVCFCILPTLGWCSKKQRMKYKDFGDRYLCCRWNKKPRVLQQYGDMEKFEPKPAMVLLFAVKKRPDKLPFKKAIIREIVNYLD